MMEDKNIRKLVKNGRDSYYVCIPKEIVKKYGWRERQKMVVKDKGRERVEMFDWSSLAGHYGY